MPMRLRDGRFYFPTESQHMILRDGKSVDAIQADVYNNIDITSYRKTEHRQSFKNVIFPAKHASLSLPNGIPTNDVPTNGVQPNDARSNDDHADATQQRFTRFKPFKIILTFFVFLLSVYFILSPANVLKEIFLWLSLLLLIIIILKGIFRIVINTVRVGAAFIYILSVYVVLWIAVKLYKVMSLSSLILVNIFRMPRKFIGWKTIVPKKKSPPQPMKLKSPSGRIVRTVFACLKSVPIFISILIMCCCINSDHQMLDPNELGLCNGYQITMNTKTRIPAWHITPNTTERNIVRDRSPVLLHVGNTENLNSLHKLEVLKGLSSQGLHVLVPLLTLTYQQMLEAWSYAHKNGNSTNNYLWIDQIGIEEVHDLVLDMCNMNLPPSGVIIETKKKNSFYTRKSLEIWSGQCDHGSSSKSYNFLKCPLSSEINNFEIGDEIRLCVTLVTIDKNIFAR